MEHNTTKSYGFAPVSPKAAREYEEKREKLVAEVDANMLSREDLAMLIGPDGKESMLDNHKNHAAFIALVLGFNRFDVLNSTLPWVYRAYRNRGFSCDYVSHALGFWMDAARKIRDNKSVR